VKALEGRGLEVVTPVDLDDEEGTSKRKQKLDSLHDYHLEIARSDAVLVVNGEKDGVANYVGPHTLIEMGFATALRRPLFALNPLPEHVGWRDELLAMDVEVLDGDVGQLADNLVERGPYEFDTKDFKLERLKFILQQIDRLNERCHRNLIFYQTIVTAIVGASATVFVGWKKLGVPADVARTAITALIWLMLLTATFVVLSIVTGIRAWFDFRQEEVKVFEDVVGPRYRRLPTPKNLFHWQETALAIFVVVSALLMGYFGLFQMLPLVQ